MRLLSLLLGFVVALGGCNALDNEARVESNVKAVEVDELVKHSQVMNKLGNYQELFVAPYKGGYAVVHASTPKGLDSNALAFYWVQDKQQQAYAINEAAINLSPKLPGYNKLPIEINPDELLAAVKKNY